MVEDQNNAAKVQAMHEMEMKGVEMDLKEREQKRKEYETGLKGEQFAHQKDMDLANLQKEIGLEAAKIDQTDRVEAGRQAQKQSETSVQT